MQPATCRGQRGHNRRRQVQENYNRIHNITPATIQKNIVSIFDFGSETRASRRLPRVAETAAQYKSLDDLEEVVKNLEDEMHQAARDLEFERAAELRDQIKELQKLIVFA